MGSLMLWSMSAVALSSGEVMSEAIVRNPLLPPCLPAA